ncbi:MAG: hypothetical protein KBF58_05645 [Methyloversatilis sp.]|jgi:hypothetical protein|nr:hypothetical protein [Methyloversatilis sp.]MBP6194246.1 hypothetical protein [Methyloversatilis sp.]MBP9117545.1 hypothetical protein [Methyloversatilis sp.]
MDVFYYWKDHAADLKAGRIGRFRTSRSKLAELQEGVPDRIWVFKTPKGLKGQVQLLARLRWSDSAVVRMERKADEHYFFYNPQDIQSVSFTDTGTPEAIDAATDWVRRNLPVAIHANFQGENGQHAMRGAMVMELDRWAKTLSSEPFASIAAS